jgi:hypothetical protein
MLGQTMRIDSICEQVKQIMVKEIDQTLDPSHTDPSHTHSDIRLGHKQQQQHTNKTQGATMIGQLWAQTPPRLHLF